MIWPVTKAKKEKRGKPSKPIPVQEKRIVTHAPHNFSKPKTLNQDITFLWHLQAVITRLVGIKGKLTFSVAGATVRGKVCKWPIEPILLKITENPSSKNSKPAGGKSIQSKTGKP